MLQKSIAGLAMCLLAFAATAQNKNTFTISENFSAASMCIDIADAKVSSITTAALAMLSLYIIAI